MLIVLLSPCPLLFVSDHILTAFPTFDILILPFFDLTTFLHFPMKTMIYPSSCHMLQTTFFLNDMMKLHGYGWSGILRTLSVFKLATG